MQQEPDYGFYEDLEEYLGMPVPRLWDHIHVDVVPMGKPRMTQRDKWAKREVVRRYYSLADDLRSKTKKLSLELPEILSVTFLVPMPKSYFTSKGKIRKGKPHPGDKHKLKPDNDNMIKSVQDILAKDDRFVHTYFFCRKIWAKEGGIVFHIKR